mmetsp:Transcript_5445/g.11147  ORF Transcript_5445/g.11147 Transcript_5445/m.11147 type:complete len:140 (+) Transcript_5445:34-453(+)
MTSRPHRYHEVEMVPSASLSSGTKEDDDEAEQGIFHDSSSIYSYNNSNPRSTVVRLRLSLLVLLWIASLLITAYWVRQFTLSQSMSSSNDKNPPQPCNSSGNTVVGNADDHAYSVRPDSTVPESPTPSPMRPVFPHHHP